MINGLSSLSKRQVYKNTREPIGNYLKVLLKQKILIKIVKNIHKKCLDLLLKNKLNKWRIIAHKMRLEEFRAETFLKTVNHIDNRLDKKR